MPTQGTRLITFGISHYCEKARWALDWHGIRFVETGWPPGPHLVLARRLGVPGTSLPILVDGGTVIQGSGAIIDWADQQAPETNSLSPSGENGIAREIEQRADEVLGVHVRRLFYAEVLSHYPQLAKPWLFLNASLPHRLLGNLMWPKVRKIMIKVMDAGPEAAPDSRARLGTELDWIDAQLEHRPFLGGHRFSRVDLTVASLLAPFARPAEAGVYAAMELPPALTADVERWRERPVMQWVNRIYGKYRRAPLDASVGMTPTATGRRSA
jgi:glutathione S-transferase